MNDLASRLMAQGRESQSILPTAIFGTAGTVRHALASGAPPVRIGLWPIRSTESPRVAMGLGSVLAYLLERYRNIRVYQIVARVDGQPDDYEWIIRDSQFDVDDWQLDDLDDNVGVWGNLDHWNLELNIENDLAPAEDADSEVTVLSYNAGSLSELVGLLPQIASDIASRLDVADLALIAPAYAVTTWDDRRLAGVLTQLFEWELRLYLSLWGQPWTDAEMLDDAENLNERALGLGNLGAWLVSSAVVRVLGLVEAALEGRFVEVVDTLVEAYPDDPIPSILLSKALFERGLPREAYELLEARTEEGGGDGLTYLALADLYRRGGRIAEAVDTFQSAIEYEHVDLAIYRRYAELLIALDYEGLSIEAYVLIDPDDIADHRLLWEGVEAYEAALALEPDNPGLLSAQTLQLIDLGDNERLWRDFRKLIEVDISGDYTHAVIDGLQSMENLQPAIAALTVALQRDPSRADLYLDLAEVYTFIEDNDAARATLQQARRSTDDPDMTAEIERLSLVAEDPDFEARLGEITDAVSAGAEIDAEDVEYLEHVLERVPTFAEVYVLVAKAYLLWGELSTALETLLDGHKNAPDEPGIIALLSETLWESGEEDLALSYLDKGITSNPTNVPLLALAGQYLFDDGQGEAAKAYLQRAEMISPRDPVLIKVRQHIGRILNQ